MHDDAIEPDPLGWIMGRLSDLPGMLTEAGHPDLIRDLDPGLVRQAMPALAAGEKPVCAVENGRIVGIVDRNAAFQAIAGEGGV